MDLQPREWSLVVESGCRESELHPNDRRGLSLNGIKELASEDVTHQTASVLN